MTKRDLVWLLIRLAGVYFAYLAVITFFTTINSGWGLIFAPPKLDIPNANSNKTVAIPGIQPAPYDPNMNPALPTPNNNETLGPEDKVRRETIMSLVGLVVLTLIYGGIGFYLLRDGRLFYLILMREETEKKKDAEPEVTTLNL